VAPHHPATRRLRVLLVLALSAGGLSHVSAVNGTIRGRVELRGQLSAVQARPNIADLGLSTAPRPIDRRRAIVYLETAPRAAFDDREYARAKMDQRDQTFVPHVLAIQAGTVVEFPNNDRTYHNVFSLSRARPFDLGRYAAGQSKAVRFDRPGIVRVFCEIHSHMSAFILVFAHRYYAMTDEAGQYRIDQIPPGTYAVTAWHDALPQQSRQITIGAAGGEVELNFTLERR
jgi:plastocyanin